MKKRNIAIIALAVVVLCVAIGGVVAAWVTGARLDGNQITIGSIDLKITDSEGGTIPMSKQLNWVEVDYSNADYNTLNAMAAENKVAKADFSIENTSGAPLDVTVVFDTSKYNNVDGVDNCIVAWLYEDETAPALADGLLASELTSAYTYSDTFAAGEKRDYTLFMITPLALQNGFAAGKTYQFDIVATGTLNSGEPIFEPTGVDLEKNGGTINFVITGTSRYYEKEDLEATLQTVYFDLEYNGDAGAKGWGPRESELAREVNVEDNGSWSLKFNITRLEAAAYTAHFGSSTTDLHIEDRSTDGNSQQIVSSNRTFTLINKNGEQGADGDGFRFWGAVGIYIVDGSSTELTLNNAYLEVEGDTNNVYLVLQATVRGYNVRSFSLGDTGDITDIAKVSYADEGDLFRLYFNVTDRAANGNAIYCHFYVDGVPYQGEENGDVKVGNAMKVATSEKIYELKRDGSTYDVLQIIVYSDYYFSFVKARLEQDNDQVYMVFDIQYSLYTADELKSFYYYNDADDRLYADKDKTVIGSGTAKIYINITDVNGDGEWWYGHWSINDEKKGDINCDIEGGNEAIIKIGDTEYKISHHPEWWIFYLSVYSPQ